MKKAIDFFIERSLLVNFISLILLVGGGLSVYLLQKEIFPPVSFDVIIISAHYSGSTPEDVEKLVTIEIERKLQGVDGIKDMNAVSTQGRSLIYLELDPDGDAKEIESDVRDAVDSVTDLPIDVDPPSVTMAENSRRPFIKVALRGENLKELRKAAKGLQDKIEKISGVSKANLGGYQAREIRIEVDPKRLSRYELTMGEITQAIRERNLNLSAGIIETNSKDLTVRTIGEFKTAKDIERVVVRSNNAGVQVKIKDIAIVRDLFNQEKVLQRSNGERAIFVDVKKTPSSDIVRTTAILKKVVDDYFKDNKSNIKFRYTDDLSYFVKRRLGVLTQNGLTGIVLVFLCLLAFLNFRTAVVTSFGAPIAFVTAFLIMEAVGLSLNLISMFGLILVLGMLVDDAIIVAEHFYQKVEAGADPKQAAREAAFDTIRPVTATILTTMIAFGSLFFMGGIMGKFLWQVPAVVILCLTASWLECFFVLPSHLADFVKKKSNVKGAIKEAWYMPAQKLYGKILKQFLRIPSLIGLAFLIALIISGFVMKDMKKDLFPGDDVRVLFLNLKSKVGSPVEKTDQYVRIAEKIVMESLDSETELDQIRSFSGVGLGSGQSSRAGSHYGALIIYLTPPDLRIKTTDEISELLVKKIKASIPKDVVLKLEKQQGGPPKGKPIDIEVSGEEIANILSAAKEIQMELSKQKGVISSEIDFEEGSKQLALKVNEDEAKRLGFSVTSIAREVRMAFAADSITEIRESDEDIEIKLMFKKSARSKVKTLEDLYILNSSGRRIKLSRVVTMKEVPSAFAIRRKNRKRVISVTAELDKKTTTPAAMTKLIEPIVKKIISGYSRVEYEMGGENKDTQESMFRLTKAAVIALGAIFIILVAMFSSLGQSLVIMSAIPLGLIGVVITFKVTGNALSFMALLGVVGLVGVVVNDSIVLVNFINVKRESIFPLKTGMLYREVHEKIRSFILIFPFVIAALLGGIVFLGGEKGKMIAGILGGLIFLGVLIIVILSFVNEYLKKPFVRFTEDKNKEYRTLPTIIAEASELRFRAVILTTFTTVAGLLPIAHAKGGDPFLKPMALSFAWGLLFASMVTLVFIPVSYLLHARLVDFLTGFFVQRQGLNLDRNED